MNPPPGPLSMLASERHRAILSRLQESGGVRVASLATEFAVTQETIRRDLERLDAEGKLIRTHGGALAVENDRRELPLDVRETLNLDKKRAVARRAVKEVSAGDVIALDASSTAREMARLLPDIAITVITNSVTVATAVMDRPSVRVILTGGVLDRPSLSTIGPVAEQTLERFHVQKLFFSCRAIDLARGLAVTADEHAGIKRRMLELAETAYLLADSSKFGARAVEFFASLDDIDMVITDTGLPEETRKELAAKNVRVELVS